MTQPPSTSDQGFTLVEVLVVLTISAILVTVGVPMYTSTVANARASSAANTLLATIELTRSEAIRRGMTVTACRINNPNGAPPVCSDDAVGGFAAGDWAIGWAVFAESDPAGAVGNIDPTDQLIRIEILESDTGASPRVELLGVPGPVGPISFSPDGLRVGGAAVFSINYPHAASGTTNASRNLAMTAIGQVEITRP